MDNTFICTICNMEKNNDEKSAGRNRCKECVNKKSKELYKKRRETQQGKTLEVPNLNDNETIKKPSKKQKQDVNLNEIKNIGTGLLMTSFSLLSTKLGEHWAITQDEAKSIIDPAFNILNKYKVFNNVAANIDSINLVMAVGLTIVPRIIVSMKTNEMKENEVEKNETKNNDDIKYDERPNNTTSSSMDETFNLKSIIPGNM